MQDMRYINHAINNTGKKLSDLFVLIKQNPNLPVIPCVDGEIVADDSFNWWFGSWGKASVDTFICVEDYGILYKDDIGYIFEMFFEDEKCGITKDTPKDEEEKIMREYVDMLPWQTAILVNIDLPNIPILRRNECGRFEIEK